MNELNKNEFIKKYKNLVYHVYNKEFQRGDKRLQDKKNALSGLTEEDMLQEGMLALYSSYLKYKSNMNTKFSTYAYNNIKFAMLNALGRNQIIKYPCEFTTEDRIRTQKKIKSTNERRNRSSNKTFGDVLSLNYKTHDNKDDLIFANDLMRCLDSKSKLVVNMRCNYYTYEEIGEKLGVSKVAARKRYNKSIKKIQEII
ncbi:sigma-70 family RNA polymerase sigma factor [Paraliobacillus ryukyuensis]|uniref:sigma-70 family RNA polymerase sigma factor n=1 Tax=Paraliobacillus ryukyuensis TaxID=200904 RepID=UPI0009A57E95|nr:sigma-70 family RNA polymerase sigma factor [Paraliobacillus ryukyuensis]